MKKLSLWILMAAMSIGIVGSQSLSVAQDEPAAQYKAIKKEFDEVMAGWQTKVREATTEMQSATPERRNEINKSMMAAQQDLLKTLGEVGSKMVKLAGSDDKKVAFDAIKFVLTSPYIQDAKVKKAAIANIENHLDNEELGVLLQRSGRGLPSEATENMFRVVSEKSTVKSLQGLATIQLASYLRSSKQMISSMLDNPAFAQAYPDSIDYFKKLAATKDEDIEKLLQTAADKFADVEFQGSTIGKIAKKELKLIEVQKNLQIGKVAPDIEGPDIDGVNFKLSDYRGKVVMLDFWGDW